MSTYADRLEHWRTTYYDRRTVPYEMLQAAQQIIEWGVLDAERSANVAVIRVESKLEEARFETERVRESLTKQIETLREHRDMLQRQIDKKRTLAETRSQEGEQVRVQIGRDGWQGWQIADIEEVAYRLRCGGAVDETPVKITDREASALVPAPDLVKLEDPQANRSREKVAAILGPVKDGLPGSRSEKRSVPWRTQPVLIGSACGALGSLLAMVIGWLV